MNVLLLGANGYMGPHVVRAIAAEFGVTVGEIIQAPIEGLVRYHHHF